MPSVWIAWALLPVLFPVAVDAQSIGPVIEDDCMQDVYLKYGGQGSGLNCTANDVRIASVTNVMILDDGCAFAGDTVTFNATFEVLTGAARHDIGLYFARDGGNALTGSCLVSILPFEPSNENCTGAGTPYACCTGSGTGTCPFIDLDGATGTVQGCQNDNTLPCVNDSQCASVGGPCVTLGPGIQDTCGDITPDSRNPIFHTINNMTLECVDSDGDGFLDVGACVSWRQPGNNELCLSPLYAFPGSPSKCRCDTALSIPIEVPPDPCDPKHNCPPCEPTECAAFACDSDSEKEDCNCDIVTNEPLGTSCEADGDLCTTDQCDGEGECVTTNTVDCSHLDSQCSDGVCNPATGACESVPKALSTTCEADGNLCTLDHCDGNGTCVTFDSVDCSHLDDQCSDGVCNTGTGACESVPKALSTPCETDGNLCTLDHCDGNGACVTFDTVDCSHLDDQCSDGVCNTGTGACESVSKAQSTPCEADGNLCTIDHCDGAGNCVNIDDVDCSHLDDQCNDGVCNTGTGACESAPKSISTPCEADGNLCTIDHCDGAGTCVTFNNVNCSRIDQCTDSVCNPGTGSCDPVFDPLSTPCDADGDLCTIDHCDGAGNCVNIDDVDCSHLDTQCQDGACNPGTGACQAIPKALGTTCEADGNLCTLDHCDGNGSCVTFDVVNCPGSTGQCDAGENCNPANGQCESMTQPPLGAPCSEDGDACTHEHCDGAGNCVVFDVVSCSHLDDQCNDGVCDSGTGGCSAVPKPSSTFCDDGDPCTANECDGSGNCVTVSTTDCSHLDDQCNDGVCNPTTGACESAPKSISTPCEADGNLCTIDHCNGAGACVTFDNVDCSHLDDQCSDGVCNTGTGACESVPKALSTPCETDGNLCTLDHCDGNGACVTFDTVDCSHLDDQCNDGVCNPSTGACQAIPKALSTACEADGDLCTIDHCDGNGSCVTFDTVDCSHLDDPCNDGVCNTGTGVCESVPKTLSTPCEADGDLCTIDHCDGAGNCVNIDDVDCSHLDDQCNDGVCDLATGACQAIPKALSTPCEADGNLCTIDHCDGNGACVTFDNVDCSHLDDDCNDGVCDPGTGSCNQVSKPDQTPCSDDGFSCTNDVCIGGVCTHVPNHAPCDGAFCMDNLCDPAHADADPTTGCVSIPNHANCNDGVDCTNPDLCDPDNPLADASGCVITPVDEKCDDENPCTDDFCDHEGVGKCANVCRTPGITCPDDLEFECDDVGEFGDPIIDDDCSVEPLVECTEEVEPGKLEQESTITRTCTVTNDCGNQASCQQIIEIRDTTPPEITCPPDLVIECEDFDAGFDDFGEPVVTDNCDPDPDVTVEVEQNFKDCRNPTVAGGVSPPPKIIIERTFTATDGTATVASGDGPNVAQCVQIIEIIDTTPPVIVNCPQTVVACVGEALVFNPPTCTDTCGECTVECTRSDGLSLDSPVDELPLTITCVATDECDNVSEPCEIQVVFGQCVIPTMSEWGLLCMTLLLLALAKVYFGTAPRRRTA